MEALADEMHGAIVRLAGERGWGETREAWLAKAARRAGISYRRARAFFYREPGSPRAQDVTAVRSALAKHQPVGTGSDAELEKLEAIVSRLESVADRLDAHGLGPDAGAVRSMAVRARDRLGTVG